MSKCHPRRWKWAAGASLAAGLVAPVLAAAPAGAAGVVPQQAAAARGAHWLAGQLNASGYVNNTGSSAVDAGDTLQTLLALAATGVDPAGLARGRAYVAGHLKTFVTSGGTDSPGALAYTILLAHATGANPRSFGGSNLVARLQATQGSSGLFGSAASATYDGTFVEGLALVALASAGVHNTAGVNWLKGQQCADGGWDTYRSSTTTPCAAPSPNTFPSPDTNSTALAVQGLVAQGAAVSSKTIGFLAGFQTGDGGWSYQGGQSDANSTAVVLQALRASGRAPTAPAYTKGGNDGENRLLALQTASGPTGVIDFQPPSSGFVANRASQLVSTEQAVLGLAGTPYGFGPRRPGGYRLVAADGGVFSFGAPFYGSHGGSHLNSPIVGTASTADGRGYYMVAADGGVFAYGDASFVGSEGGSHLNSPIVGMALDPATGGYWMVAADGGVFSFGAPFFGSHGGSHLNSPIVGMAPTADGRGYYMVAADGGVFAYGDASFVGSEGGSHLNSPIVGMALDPATGGYWMVAADGGVFSFGAPFYGSHGGSHLNSPIVGMDATGDGQGYRFVAADGGVFAYGSAPFEGSEGGTHLNSPIVGTGGAPAS